MVTCNGADTASLWWRLTDPPQEVPYSVEEDAESVSEDIDSGFVFGSVVRASLFEKVTFSLNLRHLNAEMKLSAKSQRRGNQLGKFQK